MRAPWTGAVPLAVALLAGWLRGARALGPSDVPATKVWLDRHLFNMTLKTTRLPGGAKVWTASEGKAAEQGLRWPPPAWPTLCFLGLGPASVEYLSALAQLFPELNLVLLDVEDEAWLDALRSPLGADRSRIQRGHLWEFEDARGPDRRVCQAISWSHDTPPFSFYRYRHLFYSSPFVLAIFNMQGCTLDSWMDSADRYYCDYLYTSFRNTLCGQMNEQKNVDYGGEELFFPMVDSACADHICMCHAESDTFFDFHFEQLCRGGPEEHRFTGQWGQDEFLLRNIFYEARQEPGVYVDVGASHPFHLSNTAYFDSCLGWRGLCLEPNPSSRPALQSLRSCEVVGACAWSSRTSMRFEGGGELTTAVPLASSGAVADDGGERAADADDSFEAPCAPLHELLLAALPAALGLKGSLPERPRIDLLSVDAEGAEIEIFRDFPFDSWDVRVVVVETSRRTTMALDSLLLPRGFLKVAVLGKDAVYVCQALAPALRPGGPELPARIAWNEPGSDEDTTEYLRFQRFFGVDGDLDDEVGDQRLHNESELERQRGRLDARRAADAERTVEAARSAPIGGVLSEGERAALEEPWVQSALRDPEVKALLALLTASDLSTAVQRVRSSASLKGKLVDLIKAGVVRAPDFDLDATTG